MVGKGVFSVIELFTESVTHLSRSVEGISLPSMSLPTPQSAQIK